MRAILVALIVLLLARPAAGAGEEEYRCEVESFYRFANAEFVRNEKSDLIGERFSVDRTSGVISGFELSNLQAQERLVIDRGSNKQAFKVLSVFEVYGPYQGVKYLHIEEFAQTPQKAFFAVSGSWLLTGHCTGGGEPATEDTNQ
jgi:hypothetical protein